MKIDPVDTWLQSVVFTPFQVVIYILSVLAGSIIPQLFSGESLSMAFFGYPLQVLWACAMWGYLCWAAWLSVPVLFYYLYSYLHRETQKRDIFIAFSISFFTFLSFCLNSGLWLPLLTYGLIYSLYWHFPRMIKNQSRTMPSSESSETLDR